MPAQVPPDFLARERDILRSPSAAELFTRDAARAANSVEESEEVARGQGFEDRRGRYHVGLSSAKAPSATASAGCADSRFFSPAE